jgi:monothiol glutaredoxin
MSRNIFQEIQNLIDSNNVVIFMKGTKNAPMCGFSGIVVNIFNNLNVDFVDINILEDEELRSAIKEFSDWPTIPQIYIKGEFIGGCDIAKQMFQSGDLTKLLKDKELIA